MSGLPAADQAAGRLALLTALASGQVDRSVVRRFRASRPGGTAPGNKAPGGTAPGDTALVELTAWASFAAARRVGTWIPLAAAGAATPSSDFFD